MDVKSSQTASTFNWMITVFCVAALIVVLGVCIYSNSSLFAGVSEQGVHLKEIAQDSNETSGKKFETIIRKPLGPPVIHLDLPGLSENEKTVACSTCHSTREANFKTRKSDDLLSFHQDMPFSHGSLSCYSCHNPNDADTLRLADTTVVEYANVMDLCSQCHSRQAMDYKHGAHGGMQGYWDLSRGSRTRNNCVDCHDPHVPQFPKMKPTFKPRDRFLSPHSSHEETSDTHSNKSGADNE